MTLALAFLDIKLSLGPKFNIITWP